MSMCPQCGREMQSNNCTHCATNNQENNNRQIVEAEIVENNHYHNYNSGQRQNAYGQRFTTWRFQNNAVRPELSCLPMLITLFLALSMLFNEGFLAGLGFCFFYVLGSAFSLIVTFKRALRGKAIFIWINRFLVWFFAYYITLAMAT